MIVLSFLLFVLFSLLPAFVQAPDAVFAVKPKAEKVVEITFAGDMMFDRSVRQAMEKEGGDFLFSCIAPLLATPDAVVANLEGPITDSVSKSVGSEIGSPDNFTFTFAPAVASLLKRHHVDIVNLGNNHILNFGREGVLQSIAYLDEAGVGHFGDPVFDKNLHTEIKGIRFSFITYNEFGGNSSTTLAGIREALSRNSIPIVYTHWGNEYATTSAQRQRDLAHQFIDAGAEIVIGSHPHVIQESELYKGKYIYYSLGNFFFDQYWNDDVRTGMLLTVKFGEGGVTDVSEALTYLERDRRTCPKAVE